MTPEQYLDHLAADSSRFADRTAGELDTVVDFLAGWTIRQLVAHLGGVYSGVIQVVASDSQPAADAPEDTTIGEWFAERRETLLTSLTAVPDDTPARTFAGERTVGWWKRRLAHETAVHRWDAAAAIEGVGEVAPIDGELAADGIDEYLEVGLRSSSSRPNRVYPEQSLHLHRSDGPGEWMLVGDGQGGVTMTHEHGKGDAAVRGPASDLLLWVWGRPAADVQIFGDESVADAWRSLAP